MRLNFVRIFAVILLAARVGAAYAQAPMAMPGHPDTRQPPPASASSAQVDMMTAMERMNRDMMATKMTGDPDRDLVAMMIPHHQGAIDMARIYLRTGRDLQIRRMAQKIILDQEHEIRDMRAWQAKHPSPNQ